MLANHHRRQADCWSSGWGELFRQLTYKGEWYGTRFHQIHRFFPSSKRCHVFGYIHQDLRLSAREWNCPECGTRHDRDQNAALNIQLFGHAERTRWNAGNVHAWGEQGYLLAEPGSHPLKRVAVHKRSGTLLRFVFKMPD